MYLFERSLWFYHLEFDIKKNISDHSWQESGLFQKSPWLIEKSMIARFSRGKKQGFSNIVLEIRLKYSK